MLTKLPLKLIWLPKKIYPQRDHGLGQVSVCISLQMNMLALWAEHLSSGLLVGVSPYEMDLSLRNGHIRSLCGRDEVHTRTAVNPSNVTLRSLLESYSSLPVLVAQQIVESLPWLLLELMHFPQVKGRFRNDQSFAGCGCLA